MYPGLCVQLEDDTVPQQEQSLSLEGCNRCRAMGYQKGREETLQGIKNLVLRCRGGRRAVKYQYSTCQPQLQANRGRLSYHQHHL